MGAHEGDALETGDSVAAKDVVRHQSSAGIPRLPSERSRVRLVNPVLETFSITVA
jgi:hypothetical protein